MVRSDGGRHYDDFSAPRRIRFRAVADEYEADRSAIAVVSWTGEELTKAAIDTHENTDGKAKTGVAVYLLWAGARRLSLSHRVRSFSTGC